MEGSPAASVVIASHGRALRLRWLLNALAEQRFEEPWEVVVVHTYDEETASRVLERHPLHADGRLRHQAIDPATGSPAHQRNLGWQLARAPLIAFTDDDCRPDADWLARLVDAANAHTGAVVQGTTRPEPYEHAIMAAPHVRTMQIDPVGPYVQTCNVLYPRSLLASLDGFDERAVAGEDVGLSLRARARGHGVVAAPDAVVFHAVESHTLPGIVRQNLKWRHLAYLVKQHPEFRAEMPLRVFWDRDHLRTVGLMAALAGGRRWPPCALLALPYLRTGLGRRGPGRRRLVAAAEMPGQAARQIAEVAGLAFGSLRHGTFVL